MNMTDVKTIFIKLKITSGYVKELQSRVWSCSPKSFKRA